MQAKTYIQGKCDVMNFLQCYATVFCIENDGLAGYLKINELVNLLVLHHQYISWAKR
jgi:hypothetical protein